MLAVGKRRGSGGDQETECRCRRMETAETDENSRNKAASDIKESNSRNYVD